MDSSNLNVICCAIAVVFSIGFITSCEVKTSNDKRRVQQELIQGGMTPLEYKCMNNRGTDSLERALTCGIQLE